MHQSRAQVSKKIPIPRKGTKYVAKAFVDPQNSVPVVIAVRDMLKLARTSKEVKRMIHDKALKINNKEAKELRDSIRLFNIFQADKTYVLTLTENGRFKFEETKEKERLCKVIGKTLQRKNQTQINLHDGTNILTKDEIKVNDSLYLDDKNKIAKHIPFEKGRSCLIISGKYIGKKGKIVSIENGKAKINLGDRETDLDKRRVIAL
jgi:small subunit ribosomal protein S4e